MQAPLGPLSLSLPAAKEKNGLLPLESQWPQKAASFLGAETCSPGVMMMQDVVGDSTACTTNTWSGLAVVTT